MCFSQFADCINQQITLHVNDIIFLMLACFYLGRIYQQQKYRLLNTLSSYFPLGRPPLIPNNSPPQEKTLAIESLSSLKSPQSLPESIKTNNENKNCQNQKHGTIIPENGPVVQNCYKVQISWPQEKSKKLSQLTTNDQSQYLKEKVRLDGQKIQEKGRFELFFERGRQNANIIRKIEKHQIITDYLIKQEQEICQLSHLQIVPLKKQFAFQNQNSLVEVEYYQNYKNPASIPFVQKRIIELSSERPKLFLSSYIEHGKFRKSYKNIVKIGEGGFGVVYQAQNILEAKSYAIKKMPMNKTMKEMESLLSEIKILNSLSHPNVVKYNSCWLQYAEFGEQKQSLQGRSVLRSHSQESSLAQMQNQKKKQDNEQQYCQSYFSSKNSGIGFMRSSSSKAFSKRQSNRSVKPAALVLPKDNIEGQLSLLSSSFGMMPVIYIQMQLCQHSLAHYLKQRKQIDRIFAFEIMQQLIQGVSYIHLNRIIHRDLKPENILFIESNKKISIKIGDFGLAINFGHKKKSEQRVLFVNKRAGTPSYIAPELYGENANLSEDDLQKGDVYSLGVIYYEMLNKFTTSHQRIQKLNLLKQGKVMGINQYKTEKKFIQELVKKNRLRASEIKKSQNWNTLSETIAKLKTQMLKQHKNLSQDIYYDDDPATLKMDWGHVEENLQIIRRKSCHSDL